MSGIQYLAGRDWSLCPLVHTSEILEYNGQNVRLNVWSYSSPSLICLHGTVPRHGAYIRCFMIIIIVVHFKMTLTAVTDYVLFVTYNVCKVKLNA